MTLTSKAFAFTQPSVVLEVSLEQAAQQLQWPKGLVWQVAKPLRLPNASSSTPRPSYTSPKTTWLPWQPLLQQVHTLQNKALQAPQKNSSLPVKPLFMPLPHTLKQGVPALQHFKQSQSLAKTSLAPTVNSLAGSTSLVFQRLLPKL